MRLENKAPSGGSREQAEPGSYIGVICGFCDLGGKDGQYGYREQVLVRWELRDPETGEPVTDADGKTLTANASFGATIRPDRDGNPSGLARCLIAHGVDCSEGKAVDTMKLAGWCVNLWITRDPSGQYARVDYNEFEPLTDEQRQLGKDGKLKRTIAFEHWDREDAAQPPVWAWGLLREGDLRHRCPPPRGAVQAAGSATGARRDHNAGAAGYGTPGGEPDGLDDEDIPF